MLRVPLHLHLSKAEPKNGGPHPGLVHAPAFGAAHQNARAPRNGVSRGSGYSSIVLYINSSSSRASHFLWTRPICSMLARGCAAAKSVRRSAQRAGLADNNFGPSPFCVDNCPVVLELFPVLSTTGARRQPFPSHKAQSPGSVEDSGLCQARREGTAAHL